MTSQTTNPGTPVCDETLTAMQAAATEYDFWRQQPPLTQLTVFFTVLTGDGNKVTFTLPADHQFASIPEGIRYAAGVATRMVRLPAGKITEGGIVFLPGWRIWLAGAVVRTPDGGHELYAADGTGLGYTVRRPPVAGPPLLHSFDCLPDPERTSVFAAYDGHTQDALMMWAAATMAMAYREKFA